MEVLTPRTKGSFRAHFTPSLHHRKEKWKPEKTRGLVRAPQWLDTELGGGGGAEIGVQAPSRRPDASGWPFLGQVCVCEGMKEGGMPLNVAGRKGCRKQCGQPRKEVERPAGLAGKDSNRGPCSVSSQHRGK